MDNPIDAIHEMFDCVVAVYGRIDDWPEILQHAGHRAQGVLSSDNDVISKIIELQVKHQETWRDRSESYWLARLMEEIGELAGALVGDHEHSPDWELQQVAAIVMNWLDYRKEHYIT